ncbi:MAG: DUF2007 domain-containing protein [Chlamydiae bacterium]|nr:hypothetical protein [Chlamydiales bacterium]MCH9704030.1 DUF2007 domain-containing protein [Chlamydiota bacterium]
MKEANEFVSVHRAYDTIEAELVRGLLGAEGIPSFTKGDNAGGSLSYLTNTSGIEILVNKDDAQRAQQIIQDQTN